MNYNYRRKEIVFIRNQRIRAVRDLRKDLEEDNVGLSD